MARVDLQIWRRNRLPVYLPHPLTREAHLWIAEHLPADTNARLGETVAIEWRYIGEIASGAIDDGLVAR